MDIDSWFKRVWKQIYLKIKFVAMFDSNIKYGSVIWGQIINRTNIFFLLQKEAIRTINFKDRRAHASPLFQNSNILKLLDRIKISNCLLIGNYVHNKLLCIFNKWFNFSSNFHQYKTSFDTKGYFEAPIEKINFPWKSCHY